MKSRIITFSACPVITILTCCFASPAAGQLSHLRQHGHDHKHKRKSPSSVISSSSTPPSLAELQDGLPDGLDIMPPGRRIEGHSYVMKAGFRVYDALTPPWAEEEAAAATKQQSIAFLEAAEEAAADARFVLRQSYGDYATNIFGKGGALDDLETAISHLSSSFDVPLAERLVLNMLSSRSFHVAITGQSNMAAHGSYFDESVPFVTARIVAPAFAKAGVSFATQNFAVGGGRSLPTSAWCGEAQVGPGVDVAVWEFTMTEGGKTEAQGEAWTRSMLSLPRPPAGLIYTEKERAKRWAAIYKSVVAVLAMHKPEKSLPHTRNDSATPEAMRMLHPDCTKSGAAKTRSEADVAACKQEKWSPARDLMSYKLNAKGKLLPAVYKDGKKVGGGCPGMNPWHDGHKLHRLKGSVFAHMYLRILSKAIARVRYALENYAGSTDVSSALESLRAEVSMSPVNQRQPLPHAGHDCKKVPHCQAIGKLNCMTTVEPVVAPPLKLWDELGALIPKSIDNTNGRKLKEEGLCNHGHIDHQKSVMVGKGVGIEPGYASFQLSHVSKGGAIIVCEPPTGWNRDQNLAELSDPAAVKWRLSGEDISNPKSIEMTKACYHFQQLDPPKGNATLEVKALSSKVVRITHVIWY